MTSSWRPDDYPGMSLPCRYPQTELRMSVGDTKLDVTGWRPVVQYYTGLVATIPVVDPTERYHLMEPLYEFSGRDIEDIVPSNKRVSVAVDYPAVNVFLRLFHRNVHVSIQARQHASIIDT